MNTLTRFQRSEQRNKFAAMLAAVAAMVVALALTLTLAPSAASAETPAERCKRETSAYNAAWAAIGKKPPVPYKCGGSNEPPPTLSPTEPEESPEETSGPTPSVAPESDSDGPSMNTPTERRELEHPGQDQSTIGSNGDSEPTQSGTQKSRKSASTQTPIPSASRPNSSPRKPGKPTKATFGDDSEKSLCDEPGIECTEGSALTSAMEGKLVSPPDGEERGAFFADCPPGQHASHEISWAGDRCYSDYDYIIRNFHWVANERGTAPVETVQCGVPSTHSSTLATGSETSTSEASEMGGEFGVDGATINAGITNTITQTTSTEETRSIGTEPPTMNKKVCPPGRNLAGYQRYNVYMYDLDVIDTRSGDTVGRINGVKTIVWTQSIDWVLL